MTHNQALRGHRLPGVPPDCDGHLSHLATLADVHHGPDGLRDRLVSTYQCDRCGRRLSLARALGPEPGTVAIAHQVLNDYLPPGRELVAELARSFGMPGRKGS